MDSYVLIQVCYPAESFKIFDYLYNNGTRSSTFSLNSRFDPEFMEHVHMKVCRSEQPITCLETQINCNSLARESARFFCLFLRDLEIEEYKVHKCIYTTRNS